jgi:large subunit ribosomal protein L6
MIVSIRIKHAASNLSQLAPIASLPAFLLPAFRAPSFDRSFSTSHQLHSKIGRAPLSVPPEVTLDVKPPISTRSNVRSVKAQSMGAVRIKGPLGL